MSVVNEFYIENVQYCMDMGIKKLIMFIQDEKSILSLKTYVNKNEIDLELIAVTFPANEKIYTLGENEEIHEVVPSAADGEKVKNILCENGIALISSSLPFEGIVIPGDNYNPYHIIEQTFNLVEPGLANLVQTILMSTDTGMVIPRERVLVMNAKLALDTIGTNTRFLFHPDKGLKINKIIN